MPKPEEGEATGAEDTSVSEVTETSTDEEFGDWDDGVSFDDADDDQESSEETKEEPASDSEEETPEDDESTDTTDENQEDQEETEDDTTSDDSSNDVELDRKQYNDEMAKRRIAEKQLHEERQAREQENLKRYLDEAGDDEMELEKRQLEVERHLVQREKASVTQDKLLVGIDKAVAGIDLFRTGTPEIKEELAKSLDDFEAMYVKKDKDGNYLEVNADVYQFLQTKADSIRRLTGIGAREQTKQKAKEKSRTVARPTRTPKEPKQDDDMAAFDEMAARDW
jgi:hypothetical protein